MGGGRESIHPGKIPDGSGRARKYGLFALLENFYDWPRGKPRYLGRFHTVDKSAPGGRSKPRETGDALLDASLQNPTSSVSQSVQTAHDLTTRFRDKRVDPEKRRPSCYAEPERGCPEHEDHTGKLRPKQKGCPPPLTSPQIQDQRVDPGLPSLQLQWSRAYSRADGRLYKQNHLGVWATAVRKQKKRLGGQRSIHTSPGWARPVLVWGESTFLNPLEFLKRQIRKRGGIHDDS